MANNTGGVALDEVGTARLAIGVEIIRGRSGGIAALLVGGRRNLAVVKGAGRKILPVPPGTPYNRKVSSPSDKQGGASSRPTTDSGTPRNRKVSSASDKQGGASSRPTTDDYFHT